MPADTVDLVATDLPAVPDDIARADQSRPDTPPDNRAADGAIADWPLPVDIQSVDAAATDLPFVPADGQSNDGVAPDLPSLPADTQTADGSATDLISAHGPLLTITPASLDLGIVIFGRTSAPQTFKVANVGTATSSALTVTEKDSFGASVSFFPYTTTCHAPLAPAESCDIVVSFYPRVVVSDSATLQVSDGTVSSEERRVVGATVVGCDPIHPCGFHGFEDTPVGQTSAALTCTICNTSTGSDEAFAVSTTGDFVIGHNGCSTSLAPGMACTLTVAFTPTKSGEQSGTVVVTGSGGDDFTQSLSGKGVDSAGDSGAT